MSPGVAVLTVYKAFDDILARLRAFGDGAHWSVTPDTELCALPDVAQPCGAAQIQRWHHGGDDVEIETAARDYMVELVEEQRRS